MFKKVFYLFTLLLISMFNTSFSHQQTVCTNYDQKQLDKLKNTNWIPVQWDTGYCYFHNTDTREDTDFFPKIEYKI